MNLKCQSLSCGILFLFFVITKKHIFTIYEKKVDQHFAHTLSVVIFIIRAQR